MGTQKEQVLLTLGQIQQRNSVTWSCTEDQNYTRAPVGAVVAHLITPGSLLSSGLRDLRRAAHGLNLNVHMLRVLHTTRVLGLPQAIETD